MIKTIFTDMGQVLVRVDFEKLYSVLAMHSSKSKSEIIEFLKVAEINKEYREGRIKTDYFLEGLKQGIEFNGSKSRLAEVWNDIFDPVIENIQLLVALRRQYEVVIISNTNPLHVDKIMSSIGHLPFFDHMVLSYEVGMSKPDPAIFRHALEISGARAVESLYIDDIEEYIQTAKDLGFSASTLEHPEDFRKTLLELGITI